MTIHIFSGRDFTKDVAAAMRTARDGPVFIAYRGRPAFVLLKIEDYYRIADHSKSSFLEVMDGIPSGSESINLDPPRLDLKISSAFHVLSS